MKKNDIRVFSSEMRTNAYLNVSDPFTIYKICILE